MPAGLDAGLRVVRQSFGRRRSDSVREASRSTQLLASSGQFRRRFICFDRCRLAGVEFDLAWTKFGLLSGKFGLPSARLARASTKVGLASTKVGPALANPWWASVLCWPVSTKLKVSSTEPWLASVRSVVVGQMFSRLRSISSLHRPDSSWLRLNLSGLNRI